MENLFQKPFMKVTVRPRNKLLMHSPKSSLQSCVARTMKCHVEDHKHRGVLSAEECEGAEQTQQTAFVPHSAEGVGYSSRQSL